MHPEIADSDINRAEEILFGRSNVFDEERVNFIKNFNTVDLLAVPGSGKTTTLLAKLILLANHLPKTSDRGILVLSHTNAAVDLIKERLGPYCPNLFMYPNFVGTMQRFVHTFLAVPSFEHIHGFKPENIDAELYNEKIANAFTSYLSPTGFSFDEKKKARHYLMANELIGKYRLEMDLEGNTSLLDSLNGNELNIRKPRNQFQKDYNDYTLPEKERIKEWLIKFKKKFWHTYKTIHYDDAYFYANVYIRKHPKICRILKHRFQYVFVDEMQDMDSHQVKLLYIDNVFYRNIEPNHVFQRIGDKNQAIYSYEVKLADIWIERPNSITLNKSMRLSTLIAEKVQPFALNPIPLLGENTESNAKNIKPRLILYNEDTITAVIPRFAEILFKMQQANDLPLQPKHKFKVVGWRKKSDHESKTVLRSYFPNFNSEKEKSKLGFKSLLNYLTNYSHDQRVSGNVVVEGIIDAVLRVMSLEDIWVEPYTRYTKLRLQKVLNESEQVFTQYRILLLQISKQIITKNILEAQRLFKMLCITIVQYLKPNATLSDASLEFLGNLSDVKPLSVPSASFENIYEYNGIKIYVGTVHSVKGETHCATLYLETYFFGGKSFESQKLIDQLLGRQIQPSAGKRTQQSSRIAYVGFSRPTHLLCLAVHKDRIAGWEGKLNNCGWIIEDSLVK